MALCPVCSKQAQPDCVPFCSTRCRDVDLNRWFTGGYAVPAVDMDDLDNETLAVGDVVEPFPEDI